MFTLLLSALILTLALAADRAAAQAEVRAWGNVIGIRVDGQLMAFESALRAVGVRGAETLQTAKERQSPRFSRDGDRQIVETSLDSLDSLDLRQTVTDVRPGVATVDAEVTARDDLDLEGLYFTVAVPTDLAGGGTVEFVDPEYAEHARVRPVHGAAMRGAARGVRYTAPHRGLAVTLDEPTAVVRRQRCPSTPGSIRRIPARQGGVEGRPRPDRTGLREGGVQRRGACGA